MARPRKRPLRRRRSPRKSVEQNDLRLIGKADEEELQGADSNIDSEEVDDQDGDDLRRMVLIAFAADVTGASERSISRWAKDGSIHAIMSEGRWRVDIDDVWRKVLDAAIRQAGPPLAELTHSHNGHARSPLEFAMANDDGEEDGERMTTASDQDQDRLPPSIQAIHEDTERIRAELKRDEAELERARVRKQAAEQKQRAADAEEEVRRQQERAERQKEQELLQQRLTVEEHRQELDWADAHRRGRIAELERDRAQVLAALQQVYVRELNRRALRLSLTAMELADALLDMAVDRGLLSEGMAERVDTGLSAYLVFGLDDDAGVKELTDFETALDHVERDLEGYVHNAIVAVHRRLEAA